MTAAKFTPGPWMTGEKSEEASWFYINSGPEPWTAGSLWVGIAEAREDHKGFPSIEEGRANANLIAAAPDLYEDALDTNHAYSWLMQELRDLKRVGGLWNSTQIENFADSLAAYCDAHQIGTRAALAKADGKEAVNV